MSTGGKKTVVGKADCVASARRRYETVVGEADGVPSARRRWKTVVADSGLRCTLHERENEVRSQRPLPDP